MKTITLKAKEIPPVGLEIEISPTTVCGKSLDDIKNLMVYSGNVQVKLGKFFEITGEVSEDASKQTLVFEGDLSNVKRLGQGMTDGKIVINGDIGLHLGQNMAGGKIEVKGNAAGWIGTDMTGGDIVIKGTAGSNIGCAQRGMTSGMDGGIITIEGDVGNYIGVGLNGGNITINGSAKQFVGSYMKNGRIQVNDIGLRPGYAMSGGKIVVNGVFEVPFYFSLSTEDDEYRIYEGDQGFDGKGQLYVKK